MFEPVPLEFLRTEAQAPQVLVKVNGIDALCPNLNCDFIYKNVKSSISTQAFDGQRTVVMSGDALSESQLEDGTYRIYTAMLGPVPCTLDAAMTDTDAYCVLESDAVAGAWNIQVSNDMGNLPNTAPEKITILPKVSLISPDTDVPIYGGKTLTLTGSSFGTDPSAVSVTFDDATACEVQRVSMTTITCLTPAFDTTANALTRKVTVSVNGVAATDEITFGLATVTPSATSL